MNLEIVTIGVSFGVNQPGNPVWLAEIGLEIGGDRGTYGGMKREWLYWYDDKGQFDILKEVKLKQRGIQ